MIEIVETNPFAKFNFAEVCVRYVILYGMILYFYCTRLYSLNKEGVYVYCYCVCACDRALDV